jgi:3-dehydroquinate synthase
MDSNVPMFLLNSLDRSSKGNQSSEFQFHFAEHTMPIFVGQDVHNKCIEFCSKKKPDYLFFVADELVWNLYGQEIESRYSQHFCIKKVLIKSTEKLKTLEEVNRLLEEAISAGATRRSIIVAFGGGLAGNVAGMVAGLLYRGVSMIHMPTTFLAMSDSILSLKQAVNGQRGKNLFGMYYLPQATFICVDFLRTLPDEELIAGINESIKNCLVFDAENAEYLTSLIKQYSSYSTWIELVILGIKAKQKLLQNDPYEKELGVSLEYGHTVGHALEIQYDDLPHGIAVGLGMLVAAAISFNRGWLSQHEYYLHYEMLQSANSNIKFPANFDIKKTMQIIRKDNKHGYLTCTDDQHPFVLLRSLGQVKITKRKPLVCVGEAEIFSAIEKARADVKIFCQDKKHESIGSFQQEASIV